MISHRGISVITPLPLGEGSGEGPAGDGGGASWGQGRGQLGTGEGPLSFWTLCVLFICVNLWERKLSFVREGNVVCERRETNYVNGKCKDISLTILLCFQIKAGLDARRGLSMFENMAFLFHEGRLLQARRAYTQMLNVISWFLVGYMLGCKWWCLLVLR